MVKTRRAAIPILVMIVLSLWGCKSSHVPLALDIPPVVTVPIQYAQIEDGRGRFREIYCALQKDHGTKFPYDRDCEDIVLRFVNEPAPTGKPVELRDARLPLQIYIVPGLFGECISALSEAFSYSVKHIETLGHHVDTIHVSGRHGSTHNAGQIREALLAKETPPEKKVVLIGYSKGAADILEALVEYPEVQERVAAVVSVAGVIGGTPAAEAISKPLQALAGYFPFPGCSPGDGLAIQSLTRPYRQDWLARHTLPPSVRYFSVAAIADREGISSILRSTYDNLAVIDPRNDSQVIFSDALIPGGTLLGFIRGDHWAVAMPFSHDLPFVAATLIDKNEFPREIFLEAIVRFVEESLLADMEKSGKGSLDLLALGH
jgi:pimeloyl-ACP methyl ester carboxylesterase